MDLMSEARAVCRDTLSRWVVGRTDCLDVELVDVQAERRMHLARVHRVQLLRPRDRRVTATCANRQGTRVSSGLREIIPWRSSLILPGSQDKNADEEKNVSDRFRTEVAGLAKVSVVLLRGLRELGGCRLRDEQRLVQAAQRHTQASAEEADTGLRFHNTRGGVRT